MRSGIRAISRGCSAQLAPERTRGPRSGGWWRRPRVRLSIDIRASTKAGLDPRRSPVSLPRQRCASPGRRPPGPMTGAPAAPLPVVARHAEVLARSPIRGDLQARVAVVRPGVAATGVDTRVAAGMGRAATALAFAAGEDDRSRRRSGSTRSRTVTSVRGTACLGVSPEKVGSLVEASDGRLVAEG